MGRKRILKYEQVFGAVQQWLVRHGHPPTIEELRKTLGLGSKRTVLTYLQRLEQSGKIERWPGARGIRLLNRPKVGAETTSIPIVGEAPAGPLMIAEENNEGWIRLPREFLKPRSSRFFLLRVRGNSMNRARVEGGTIESGDLVLVRQESTARPGDIVVALIDGEATIKRFFRSPGYYVLKPESTNGGFQPILVESEFAIQGIVCRVIKAGANIMIDED